MYNISEHENGYPAIKIKSIITMAMMLSDKAQLFQGQINTHSSGMILYKGDLASNWRPLDAPIYVYILLHIFSESLKKGNLLFSTGMNDIVLSTPRCTGRHVSMDLAGWTILSEHWSNAGCCFQRQLGPGPTFSGFLIISRCCLFIHPIFSDYVWRDVLDVNQLISVQKTAGLVPSPRLARHHADHAEEFDATRDMPWKVSKCGLILVWI